MVVIKSAELHDLLGRHSCGVQRKENIFLSCRADRGKMRPCGAMTKRSCARINDASKSRFVILFLNVRSRASPKAFVSLATALFFFFISPRGKPYGPFCFL